MNKEEAKKEFVRWFNPDGLLSRNLVVYEVYKLIDAIEPEYQKVVLPKAVGEQWDKLVSYQLSDSVCRSVDYALSDIVNNATNYSTEFHQLYDWWGRTPDSYWKLIDAARYGWVPKSEKLYRVKVYGIDLPGLFYRKRNDGTLSFVQGGAGMPETEFTMEEIRKRHLERCEREEVAGN